MTRVVRGHMTDRKEVKRSVGFLTDGEKNRMGGDSRHGIWTNLSLQQRHDVLQLHIFVNLDHIGLFEVSYEGEFHGFPGFGVIAKLWGRWRWGGKGGKTDWGGTAAADRS